MVYCSWVRLVFYGNINRKTPDMITRNRIDCFFAGVWSVDDVVFEGTSYEWSAYVRVN